MNASTNKWAEFHLNKVKGNFPSWPVEVMLKALFGDYLEKKPKISSNTKVLDVGCGFGNNLLPFLVLGCRCAGVEVSQDIASLTQDILHQRGFKEVVIKKGNNRNLPFEDNHFDLIISNNVLHYEKNEENILNALDEYSRVLKPGGALFLMTVGPEHLIYKRAVPLGNHRYKISNYDFRDGEIYFYFDNEKYLEFYLSKFFAHVETGRVLEKLMKVDLDFLIAVCQKKVL